MPIDFTGYLNLNTTMANNDAIGTGNGTVTLRDVATLNRLVGNCSTYECQSENNKGGIKIAKGKNA